MFSFKKFLIVAFIILSAVCVSAQVSINPSNTPPHNSAMLDVQSNNKGFLPPRMTTTQRRAIINPMAGLMVYDTDRQNLFFYNGSSWRALIAEPTPATATITGVDANDGASGDGFGINIDIHGNYAIAGAYRDDVGANTDQGSAYIYKLENNNWLQMQKITANDGQPTDRFGSVAMDSNYAFVGASQADIGAGTDQGCVYVFKLENGVWVQKQKLVSANAASGDIFGGYLSVWNNYLVIGAQNDDIGVNNNQGSAYIYKLDSATGMWVEMQKLTANDGTSGDRFGYEVNADSNSVIVSAIDDDVNNQFQRGSAYIFTLQNGVWQQTVRLIASDGVSGDNFGRSVAIKGDYALVGSYFSDVTATNQGAVYLFKLENGSWVQKQKVIASDPVTNGHFGTSIGINKNFIIIGAQSINNSQGAAYLFQLNTATNILAQIQKVTAADGVTYDYFGFSSAIDNYNILIGAYGKNSERGKIYFRIVD